MLPFALSMTLAACICGDPVAQCWTADWCKPCERVRPVIEQLRADGWPIESRDYEANRAQANRLAIRSVPCLIVLDGRREVARCTPPPNKEAIATWLERFNVKPVPRRGTPAEKEQHGGKPSRKEES